MKRRLAFIFTIISVFLFFSCGIAPSEEDGFLFLNDGWEYSLEGESGPFSAADTSAFPRLRKLVPGKRGYIWLRIRFSLPASMHGENLALNLGVTKIAEETHLNGQYIGSSGFFEPKPFFNGELVSLYHLPASALRFDGEQNELLVKLYVDGLGQLAEHPYIAREALAADDAKITDFRNSKIQFLFSAFMLLIGSLYLLIYFHRPQDKSHKSFGLMNYFSSLYLISNCLGEYPVLLDGGISMLLFVKIFEGIAPLTAGYFSVSFSRDFLGMKDSRRQKHWRRIVLVLSYIPVLLATDVQYFFLLQGISLLMLSLQLLYSAKQVIQALIKHNKRVYPLLGGYAAVTVSILAAVIIKFALKKPFLTLIIITGWQATILFFFSYLLIRLTLTASKLENFSTVLDHKVAERTEELTRANGLLETTNLKLEYEMSKEKKELELAAFVQQSFYNNYIPELKNWEVSYFSEATAGVSGDLYNIFAQNEKLDGVGIFDVSGHGIASGLITMLVKNIIDQEFVLGSADPLDAVMEVINNRIIDEKGDIENYLTGILARINVNKVELVNAGHPEPIYFSTKLKKAVFIPKESDNQYGAIGIAEFPASFKTTEVAVSNGDEILFYTDGITESENPLNEIFGPERLRASFEKHISEPLDTQIKLILEDLRTFTKEDVYADDITLLLIKKKRPSTASKSRHGGGDGSIVKPSNTSRQ